jgi:ubiquinone/menaquinone biosynthesis C-methylase UbiE
MGSPNVVGFFTDQHKQYNDIADRCLLLTRSLNGRCFTGLILGEKGIKVDIEKDSLVRKAFNTSKIYFDMMRDWHQRHGGIALEPEVERIIENHCQPGSRILEAGCGEGSINHWFARHHVATDFLGVDISQIGIRMAQEFQQANLSFLVSDLKRLPLREKTFDFVFMQSVLEHVVGWEAALAEIKRILGNNGNLLIRLGNCGTRGKPLFQSLLHYLFKRNRPQTVNASFQLAAGDYQAHMENFDVQEIPSDILLNELAKLGFHIEYFSTRTHIFRDSPCNWKAPFLWAISYCKFWPFNHLGPTTIIVARIIKKC